MKASMVAIQLKLISMQMYRI